MHRQFGDGLLAGIDQVGIFLARIGEGAHAQHAVLALQRHFQARRNIVGHQGRDADAQIDIEAVFQFARGAGGDVFAGPGHHTPPVAGRGRVVTRSIGFL